MNLSKSIQLFLYCIATPLYSIGMEQNYGIWHDSNKKENKITIEWTKIDWVNKSNSNAPIRNLISSEYNELINSSSKIYAYTFKEKENDFLTSINVGPNISGQYYLVKLKNAAGKFVGLCGFLISDFIKIFNQGNKTSLQNTQHQVLLEPLAVLPEAQGLGLAEKLIFSILHIKKEVSTIYLHVEECNQHARDTYEHYGFTICGEFYDESKKKILRYQWHEIKK